MVREIWSSSARCLRGIRRRLASWDPLAPGGPIIGVSTICTAWLGNGSPILIPPWSPAMRGATPAWIASCFAVAVPLVCARLIITPRSCATDFAAASRRITAFTTSVSDVPKIYEDNTRNYSTIGCQFALGVRRWLLRAQNCSGLSCESRTRRHRVHRQISLSDGIAMDDRWQQTDQAR